MGHGDHSEREVHRAFQLTTPEIEGPDVREFQDSIIKDFQALDKRLRHPNPDDFVDGEFGPRTRKWANDVAYALGLDPVGKLPAGPVFTKEEQSLIRDPSKRSTTQKDRSKSRVEELIAKQERHDNGAAAAVRWALSQKGTTEVPLGSNRGPLVDTVTRFCGLTPPVYWCGCFSAYAAVHEGGAKSTPGAMVHNVYMLNYARAGSYGLEDVSISEARGGDIVSYKFAHIGMLCQPISEGWRSIEGNTSPEGQNSNGGGVYEHTGATRNVSMILGVIRPAYAG